MLVPFTLNHGFVLLTPVADASDPPGPKRETLSYSLLTILAPNLTFCCHSQFDVELKSNKVGEMVISVFFDESHTSLLTPLAQQCFGPQEHPQIFVWTCLKPDW